MARCCAAYRVALGLHARRPEGARRGFPHAGGPLPAHAPQRAQRLSSSRSRSPTRTTKTCAARAIEHVDPGGSIMVHGLPNSLRHPPDYYATADWTDGCIAMSDCRHGGVVADDAGQHPDRNSALSAAPSDRPRARRQRRSARAPWRPAVVIAESVDARVGPRGSLENLSQAEIDKLLDTSQTGLYTLFRNCALAVLNSGSDSDNRQGDLRALPRLRRADPAPRLGHQARDHQRPGGRVRRRPDDPRHQGTPVRGAARRHLHRQRNHRRRPARLRRTRPRSPTRCSTSCAMRGCWTSRRGRTWSSAGAGTRSATPNTSTPSASATSWGCGRSMSAPAAGRAR